MKDENFFPKEKTKKSCGCEAIVIFFIILFIAGSFLIWQIYHRLNHPSQNIAKVEFSAQDLNNFNDKLKTIDKTGTIEITQQELTAYLNDSLSQNNFAFKNPSATINPKGVIIIAETWPKGQMQLTIFPQVIDNHLKLSLVNSNVPAAIANPILEKMIADLEQKITQNKMKLTDLELEEGKMLIKIAPK